MRMAVVGKRRVVREAVTPGYIAKGVDQVLDLIDARRMSIDLPSG
jgi:hypothetical protein